jgi:uncharacterized membrane protein YcjF (UPF0283 family)
MYCHNCGTKLNEKDKYCYKCGTPVKTKAESDKQASSEKKQDIESKVDPAKSRPQVKIVPRDKYAVLSFILSFFFVIGSVFSIILAFISFNRIKQSGQTGKSLAVTGLTISIIVLVLFLLVLISNWIQSGSANSNGGMI